MRFSFALVPVLLALLAAPLWPIAAGAQDVVVIGEVHDNPHHHQTQAELVAEIKPRALVFEMLTAEQAARLGPGPLGARAADADGLAALLGWEGSGWPDFSLYAPIFAAAPQAHVHGAGLPRERAREMMGEDPRTAFGPDADAYGLTEPLPPAEEEAREALQFEAHCEALPRDLLPGMVWLQRLRDAYLARETLRALAEDGPPVVVITGNGHARRDWGMPAVLARAMPGLQVRVIGQGEGGRPPEGVFDELRDAPPVERPDPCAAFE